LITPSPAHVQYVTEFGFRPTIKPAWDMSWPWNILNAQILTHHIMVQKRVLQFEAGVTDLKFKYK